MGKYCSKRTAKVDPNEQDYSKNGNRNEQRENSQQSENERQFSEENQNMDQEETTGNNDQNEIVEKSQENQAEETEGEKVAVGTGQDNQSECNTDSSSCIENVENETQTSGTRIQEKKQEPMYYIPRFTTVNIIRTGVRKWYRVKPVKEQKETSSEESEDKDQSSSAPESETEEVSSFSEEEENKKKGKYGGPVGVDNNKADNEDQQGLERNNSNDNQDDNENDLPQMKPKTNESKTSVKSQKRSRPPEKDENPPPSAEKVTQTPEPAKPKKSSPSLWQQIKEKVAGMAPKGKK